MCHVSVPNLVPMRTSALKEAEQLLELAYPKVRQMRHLSECLCRYIGNHRPLKRQSEKETVRGAGVPEVSERTRGHINEIVHVRESVGR